MLQWIISSSVLIAVILLLRLLLKGRISLRLQYGLWALVLLRLLLPFTIGSSPISVSNFAPMEAQTPPPVVAVDQESADQDQPHIVVPDQSWQPQVEDQIPQSQPPVTQQPDTQQPITQQLVTQAPTEPAATDSHNKINLSAAEILRTLWIIGTVAVGIWFAAVNLRMHRKLRASRRPVEVENCSLPVYVSDQVDTPCLFGLFRPAIYLTENCLEDESTLRYAIVHEQTHYRHLDFLWALLRCLCLALHWYNPLVWWAALASQKDAELACDESVLRRLGDSDRAPYGRALLRLTCEKRPRLLSVSTTMTGSAKNIKERITMIVKKPQMAIYTLVAVLLITAITVGCTFTGAEVPEQTETDATEDILPESTEPTTEDPTTTEDNTTSSESDREELVSPEEAIRQLYSVREEMWIWLELADGGCTRAFCLNESWYIDRFTEYMQHYDWTEPEQTEDIPQDRYVMLQSPNQSHKLKIYSDRIFYENGEESFIWIARPKEGTSLSLVEFMRPEYDRLEESYTAPNSWSYAMEGNAEEAVQIYAEQYHRQTVMKPLTPGNLYAVIDYQLIDYRILSVREDGNFVEFEIYYAFMPANTDPNNNPLAAGGVEVDREEYGGMWTTSSVHHLERAMDGLWHFGMISNESAATIETPSSPAEAFELLYGEPQRLRMYLKQGSGEISSVLCTGYPSYFEILMSAMEEENWEKADPSEFSADGDFAVMLLSEDGRHMLAASGKTLLYETEGLRLCWRETENTWWREEETLAAYLYERIYQNEEVSITRISFSSEGTAEDAARCLVEEEYARHFMNLSENHWFAYSAYKLRDWGILETSEDGNAVLLWFDHAFTPKNSPLDQVIIGNGGLGTGDYEGMVYTYREVVLRKMSDGKWYLVGGGTGGVTLRDGF